MGQTDINELVESWKRADIPKITLEELGDFLEKEYRAYHFPLRYILAGGMPDDELREEFIADAFTITHPGVLRRLDEEDEKYYPSQSSCLMEPDFESQEEEDDFLDECERDRFIDDGPDPGEEEWHEPITDLGIIFDFLQDQHNDGKRITIVVEEEGGFVVNFKLYGWCQRLSRRLIAMMGFLERDHRSEEEFPSLMITGDLNDEGFVYYLECLREFDMI